MKKLRHSRAALIGVCCALVGAAAVPVASLAGITGSTGDGPMVTQSGYTTLAYTAERNVSSISNSAPVVWSRVGDTVTMSGWVLVNPTSPGLGTTIYVPLPVASNLGGHDCWGSGAATSTAYVVADAGPSKDPDHLNECTLDWITPNTVAQNLEYTLQYRVKD